MSDYNCPKCGGNDWDWDGLDIEAGADGKGTADIFKCLTCGHTETDTLVIYDSDFQDVTEEVITRLGGG